MGLGQLVLGYGVPGAICYALSLKLARWYSPAAAAGTAVEKALVGSAIFAAMALVLVCWTMVVAPSPGRSWIKVTLAGAAAWIVYYAVAPALADSNVLDAASHSWVAVTWLVAISAGTWSMAARQGHKGFRGRDLAFYPVVAVLLLFLANTVWREEVSPNLAMNNNWWTVVFVALVSAGVIAIANSLGGMNNGRLWIGPDGTALVARERLALVGSVLVLGLTMVIGTHQVLGALVHQADVVQIVGGETLGIRPTGVSEALFSAWAGGLIALGTSLGIYVSRLPDSFGRLPYRVSVAFGWAVGMATTGLCFALLWRDPSIHQLITKG